VNFRTLDISAGVVYRTVQQLVRLSVHIDKEASPYGLVVNKVTLGSVFLQVLRFSPLSIIP
jgi:hypothetical protein